MRSESRQSSGDSLKMIHLPKLPLQVPKLKVLVPVQGLGPVKFPLKPTKLPSNPIKLSLPPLKFPPSSLNQPSTLTPIIFEQLPAELNFAIFDFLDFKSLARLYITSKRIQKFTQTRIPNIHTKLVRRTRMVQYIKYVKYTIINTGLGLIDHIKIVTSLGILTLKIDSQWDYEVWILTEEIQKPDNSDIDWEPVPNILTQNPLTLTFNGFVYKNLSDTTHKIESVFEAVPQDLISVEIHKIDTTYVRVPNHIRNKWLILGTNKFVLEFTMFDRMYNFTKLEQDMQPEKRRYGHWN